MCRFPALCEVLYARQLLDFCSRLPSLLSVNDLPSLCSTDVEPANRAGPRGVLASPLTPFSWS